MSDANRELVAALHIAKTALQNAAVHMLQGPDWCPNAYASIGAAVEHIERAIEKDALVAAVTRHGWVKKKFGEEKKWYRPAEDDGARYLDHLRGLRNICEDYGISIHEGV